MGAHHSYTRDSTPYAAQCEQQHTVPLARARLSIALESSISLTCALHSFRRRTAHASSIPVSALLICAVIRLALLQKRVHFVLRYLHHLSFPAPQAEIRFRTSDLCSTRFWRSLFSQNRPAFPLCSVSAEVAAQGGLHPLWASRIPLFPKSSPMRRPQASRCSLSRCNYYVSP